MRNLGTMASPDQSTAPTSIASYEEPPPTIQFTNIKALCQAIEDVSGDFLVVQNISPTDFEEINRQEPRRFRLRRYHADREILIITIPNDLHEALHIGIYRRYDYQLGPGAGDQLGVLPFDQEVTSEAMLVKVIHVVVQCQHVITRVLGQP
ncbi:hypothetical protein F4805DRAFT_414398 [Annulohypoxylon moriforme]|nr:hypothetical protein F4805DRAFT_414398 [Annulohypoxylon moriforme]